MRREGNRGRSEDLPLTSSSYLQRAYCRHVHTRIAKPYATAPFAPCLDERLHGPAPQLRRSEHCNLGDDSAFALLPCGISEHQVGFGWHRRAKATKTLTNPWAIYATHCSCIYKAGEALRLSHSAFPFRFFSFPSPARRCPVLIHLGPVTRRCSIA